MYPQVGDNIDIEWETKPEQVSDGVSECVSEGVAPVPLRAEVIAKEECSKEKHGSKFKFKLKFASGEVRETRLMHKQFRVVSECVSEGVSEGEGGVKSKEKKDKKMKKEKKDKKDKKDKKRKVEESDGVQSEEKEKEKAGSDRDSGSGGIRVKKRKRKASTDTVTDTDTGTGAGTDTDTGSGIVSSTAVVGGARGLPVHRFILAPMVGGSELAFRLLCRRYGTGKIQCIVLYCIVLYCIVLYCIVLYCIVLCYCIVLYCIVLCYCIVLHCVIALYCIVL
jgi:hypothetical protein